MVDEQDPRWTFVANVAQLGVTLGSLYGLLMMAACIGSDGGAHYFAGVDWAGASVIAYAFAAWSLLATILCRRWWRVPNAVCFFLALYWIWQNDVWGRLHIPRG